MKRTIRFLRELPHLSGSSIKSTIWKIQFPLLKKKKKVNNDTKKTSRNIFDVGY